MCTRNKVLTWLGFLEDSDLQLCTPSKASRLNPVVLPHLLSTATFKQEMSGLKPKHDF